MGKNVTFATGCFWCAQPPFEEHKGVLKATVGYTGGHLENPSYNDMHSGKTGHREGIHVVFDPKLVSYKELLDIFWKNIDPTDPGGQFFDRGQQYTTAVYYHDAEQKKLAEESKKNIAKYFDKPIATEILPYVSFYTAEEYHQQYAKKNARHYMLYKKGSGREKFLKDKWAK